ncbi:tyrosine/nicotianamine aminotransferase, pyridoxal phosphate-dependent transferase, partial [Tanacetum coccineum]
VLSNIQHGVAWTRRWLKLVIIRILNLSDFDDIVDDRDFCMKLAKEESVIVFPGSYGSWLLNAKGYQKPQYVDREKSLPRPLPPAAIVEPIKDDDTNVE